MGGDGGTVAADRRYLRGAGAASHTADAKRHQPTSEDERERLNQIMTSCAVTGQPLDLRPRPRPTSGAEGGGVSSSDIVACPYGRLYNREAAVQALLRRMETHQSQAAAAAAAASSDDKEPEPDIGWHVRGLKDLFPVRFQVVSAGDKGGFVAVCPLTGVELNGSTPAFLIVKKKDKSKKSKDAAAGAAAATTDDGDMGPNVLSERAIREVGADSLQEEYGPFDLESCVRLAPTTTGGIFERVKADLEQKRAEEKSSKKNKKDKKDKKRKDKKKANGAIVEEDDRKVAAVSKKPKYDNNLTGGPRSAAEAARANVDKAVASNPALSSLFSTGTDKSSKEHKDALFTQNC